MHDIFAREPDPLDGILRPPSTPDNSALRQQVYARTQRVLQRRRRWRQLAYAAGLAASFVAGLVVMRLINPGERGRVSAPSEQTATESTPNTPAIQDLGALTQPRSPRTDDTALTLENNAFDSTDHRRERYQHAGDTYMNEEYDPQSALRCFRNALDSGTKQDLAISTNDNWLLMAIKDARQKETDHAKQGG
jgi:hypothetical protein